MGLSMSRPEVALRAMSSSMLRCLSSACPWAPSGSCGSVVVVFAAPAAALQSMENCGGWRAIRERRAESP